MKSKVLLDAGPLVAYFQYDDGSHAWAVEQFEDIAPPLLTCDAVLSEACFLLRNRAGGSHAVLEMLARKVIRIPFRLEEQHGRVQELIEKYEDVPMSLADACLVRMAEMIPGSVVFTLDDDFRIYRKHRREHIPLIAPDIR